MLRPLLEKPDALYFGIKGQQMTFAARISFFLSDMLEADEITATYKAARCNMPCHTCMVLMKDLNNMKLVSDDMMPRTHKNMQRIIRNGQEKSFLYIQLKMPFGNSRKYHQCKLFFGNK